MVIGHGRVTGPEALCLTEDFFPRAKRIQVVHVAPDELEWWKQDRADDAGVRAEVRTQLELDLAVGAYRTLTVGPLLHARMCRDLSVYGRVPEPVRLDPGFDCTDPDVRTPPPGGPVQILLMGRIEDYKIKGVELASRALARAMWLRGNGTPEIELLVRGAPPGQSTVLRERILKEIGGKAVRVTVRPFTTDESALRHDLARASLVLMPSWAESFGLVGLEAIIAGTPVFVSGQSGLGMLLSETVDPAGTAGPVVPVTQNLDEDVDRWGHRIAAVLDDRESAFTRAERLRRDLAAKWTWESAARNVLSL
jgi:glycosyltransferase involved in cell wall biosynthesis